MNIKDKCWQEALRLLVEYDSLTVKDFILSLTSMGFSDEIIVNTLNDLAESPLTRFDADGFRLDI